MTHTTTIDRDLTGVIGHKKQVFAKVVISSYTAGGEVITAEEFGLTKIRAIAPGVSSTGIPYTGDVANLKILCWMCDNNASADSCFIAMTTGWDSGDINIVVYGI